MRLNKTERERLTRIQKDIHYILEVIKHGKSDKNYAFGCIDGITENLKSHERSIQKWTSKTK